MSSTPTRPGTNPFPAPSANSGSDGATPGAASFAGHAAPGGAFPAPRDQTDEHALALAEARAAWRAERESQERLRLEHDLVLALNRIDRLEQELLAERAARRREQIRHAFAGLNYRERWYREWLRDHWWACWGDFWTVVGLYKLAEVTLRERNDLEYAFRALLVRQGAQRVR